MQGSHRIEFKRRLTDSLVFMRVFCDLEMVAHPGSGITRIMRHYPKSVYVFLNNFTRIVLSYAEGFTESLTKPPQANGQANKLLAFCQTARSSITGMMEYLGYKHRIHTRTQVLEPLLEPCQLEMTLPDKPKSQNQKNQTKEIKNETR